jgi:uncharacterized repeat protein (TIGR03803 family)
MGFTSLRSFISLKTVVILVLVIGVFAPIPALAQSYCGPVTTVNFNGLNGQYPAVGVTFDSHGTMYGTTTQGGPSFNPTGNQGIFNNGLGTIWKYTPSAGLTSLFAFSGETSPSNNGYRPLTPLSIDGQGNLYGTTYYGGNDFSPNVNNHFGWGTLFKYSSGGQFSVLYEFNGPDGANPIGGHLFDSQGNLWGTTWQGGIGWNPTLGGFGLGTVFEYSSGGTLTNPVLFTSSNGGGNIDGGMATDGQGNYYGTTYEGGTNGFGTLFQYNSTTGQLTTLFNFNRNPNGSLPAATVTYDGKGNLYGTTYQGGSHSSASNYCCGTVWKYSLSSGVLTTLVNFDGDTVPADGQSPMGGVTLDNNGNLYGTTIYGGTAGDGIVYEYSSTGVLSTLVTFSGPNGQNPEGNLVFDSSGNLWGITNQGGTPGYGTVYELTPNAGGGTCGGVTVSSLTFNPSSIPNGGTTTGTVTLSGPAPSGGSVVGLTDDNLSVLNVPSSVTVLAGATTATFQAPAKNLFVLSNTVVTVTASLGNNSTAQGTVTVTTGIAVTRISMNPSTINGGGSSTGTVTIASAAPSGGNEVLISLSQNPPCFLPVNLPIPNPVTVPAGSTSVSFTVTANSTTTSCTAPIYGQSGAATVSTNFTVRPGSSSPTVSSVTLNPTSVTGGNNSTGTVTLSSAAPSGGSTVSLSSSNTSAATVPSSVTVSSGQTSANFTVNTSTVTTNTNVTITATLGSSSKQATLTVTPASSPTVSSVTLNPTSVTGGTSSQGTVTLSSAAPSGGSVVSLSSNSSSASVPSSVTVPSGSTSATFTVTTTSVTTTTTATITATLGSSSQPATLTITPASGSVTLSSLTLNPTSVSGQNNSTGTVTLTGAAPSGGAVVTLSSSKTSVASVPSSVTVAAGNTSASFTVSTQRVFSNTSVVISATYAGTTKQATLTVTSGRQH